jgi:hypothetical protein
MAFWNSLTNEPLRKNRWSMILSLAGGDLITFALKECSKPEISTEIETVNVGLGQPIKYRNKPFTWQPINIKFVSVRGDDQNGDAAKILFESLKYSFNNPNINSRNDKITSIEIQQFDASANKVEVWELKNCLISNISFGTLSYEEDGFVEISAKIDFDYAELKSDYSKQEYTNKTQTQLPPTVGEEAARLASPQPLRNADFTTSTTLRVP